MEGMKNWSGTVVAGLKRSATCNSDSQADPIGYSKQVLTAVESADVILCFGDYFWFNFCQNIPEFSKLIEQKLSSGTPFFLEFVRAAEALKSRQLHSSVGQFLRRLGVIPTQNKIFSVLDAHLDHESGGSCWFRSEDGLLDESRNPRRC
jgi:hypothetical protein